MHSQILLSTLILLFSTSSTIASPLPESQSAVETAAETLVLKRQNAVTCGSIYYDYNSVSDALNAGCNYYQQDSTAGGSTYPHTYNNYEGFDFPVSGPYQEFPLIQDAAYDGGSPGADRVIFNGDCQYAGSITHTGASGNAFVGCSDTE